MKVTKLIREYVEEQVSKVYDAKVNPYSEQAEIDRQKIKVFDEYLHDQQRNAIEQFLSENPLFESCWNGGFRQVPVRTSTTSFSGCLTPAMIDERKWSEENNKSKRAKVREISLALELGANRQELNDMIARLLEESE